MGSAVNVRAVEPHIPQHLYNNKKREGFNPLCDTYSIGTVSSTNAILSQSASKSPSSS